MPRQATAGQNEKKNNSPGPIGFGLGSGHNPTQARTMINNSGVQPTKAMIAPILKSRLFKYSFAALPAVYLEVLNEPRLRHDAFWPDTQLIAYELAKLDEDNLCVTWLTDALQFQDHKI